MTQLELPLHPAFTLSMFIDAVANIEASCGYKPVRAALTRKRFDELVASLPPGAVWSSNGQGMAVFNGTEIEVYD